MSFPQFSCLFCRRLKKYREFFRHQSEMITRCGKGIMAEMLINIPVILVDRVSTVRLAAVTHLICKFANHDNDFE